MAEYTSSEAYAALVGKAVAEFFATVMEDIEPGASIEDINDEFMLQLYETTGDNRRV